MVGTRTHDISASRWVWKLNRHATVHSPCHIRHDANSKTSAVFESLTPQVSLQLTSGLGGYTR
jgi:hypothetical protein